MLPEHTHTGREREIFFLFWVLVLITWKHLSQFSLKFLVPYETRGTLSLLVISKEHIFRVEFIFSLSRKWKTEICCTPCWFDLCQTEQRVRFACWKKNKQKTTSHCFWHRRTHSSCSHTHTHTLPRQCVHRHKSYKSISNWHSLPLISLFEICDELRRSFRIPVCSSARLLSGCQ